jgi:outer membrane protein, heavy metal efflux system
MSADPGGGIGLAQGGSMVRSNEGTPMRAPRTLTWGVAAAVLCAGLAADAAAQGPVTHVTMGQAVQLTLDRNQTLRVQRLTVDLSKADETTAALKPNPGFSFDVDSLTLFSPRKLNGDFWHNGAAYTAGLDYTFERGGKRRKRIRVAEDATDVTAKGVLDAERQARFQTEQAFIAVLLAKSALELAQQNLKSFSDIVDVNRQRVQAGDLAEAEFYRISLQKLQFEQDVSAAEVGLVQARAALRQLMGYDNVADDFDVDGNLAFTKYTLSLDDLKRQALESRADVLAAQANTKLAEDTVALETGNRARDVTGAADYTHLGPDNTFDLGVSFELPFHDRNQGNIAHSRIAVRQASQAEEAARFTAITDVVDAYAAFQTSLKVVGLYQSGYLDQARKSLEITTYVYQRGAGSVLDLLDAERTYRETELAHRQALADYMASVSQVNFAVGKQVIP